MLSEGPRGRSGSLGITARIVVLGTLATSLLVVIPSAEAAPLCAFDSTSHTLTVTGQPGVPQVTLQANGPYVNVNDVDCALLSGVDTVDVDMSPVVDPFVYLSSLAPGFTNEGNGSSEIEFRLSGLSTGGSVTLGGTTGADGIRVGQFLNRTTGVLTGQVNLNALSDGATPDVDVSFTTFPGRMRIFTGSGNDILSAAGAGTISSPYGLPVLLDDGLGADQVTGGSGDDLAETWFDTADGADSFSGGGGTDTFTALSDVGIHAAIRLDGLANDGFGCPGSSCVGDNVGSDFEIIQGSSGEDLIVGDADAETIIGGGGQDILKGLGGNDTLQNGGDGTALWANVLMGGAGDDVLIATPGAADTMSGGGGVDTVSFASVGSRVVVSLDDLPNDGTSGQGADVGEDVENVSGSDFGDLIFGSASDNTILGGRGPDDLRGLGGNDVVSGQGGNDDLNGGPGADTCSQGAGTGTIVNCEA
jgi:Ca2+-binding RTX toxin-like protein